MRATAIESSSTNTAGEGADSPPTNAHGTREDLPLQAIASSSLAVRLASLLALMILPALAGAQVAGLTINVVAGFDGYYRPGRWCPVVVSISNQPPNGKPGDRDLDFRGTLVVESRPEEDDSPSIHFTRDILTPAFSNQRYFLYAKFPETLVRKPTLTLRSESGKRLAEFPLEVQNLPTERTLTVIAGESLGTLAIPSLRGDLDCVTRAKTSFKSLPDSWMGYDPASVFILPSWDETAMMPATREALTDWVAMGGTLVFLGGKGTATYGDGKDNALLPVLLSGTGRLVARPQGLSFEERSGGAAGDGKERDDAFVASIATAKEGARVLLSALGGEPLLVRRPLGAGQVLFLALDLESTSARLNDALLPYWAGVMPLPNLASGEFNYVKVLRRGRTGDDRNKSSDGLRVLTGRSGSPPNHFVISLIAMLYAAVVGPVNFYALARMKRFDLAWATVPAIVVVFSVLIYGLGRATRGGTAIVREVSLVRGAANDTLAGVHSSAAIFTNVSGDFNFLPPEPRVAVADEYRWNAYEGLRYFASYIANPIAGTAFALDEVRPIVRTGEDDVGIREWPMRPFEVIMVQARQALRLDGPIEGSLTLHSPAPRLRGSITNRTGRDFAAAYLSFGGRILGLGPMRNGASVSIGEVGGKGVLPQDWMLASEELSALGVPPPGSSGDSPAEVNMHNAAIALHATLFPPVSSTRVFPVDGGSCKFLAVAERTGNSFQSNIEAEDTTHAEAFLVDLPYSFPSAKRSEVERGEFSIRLHSVPENQNNFDLDERGRIRFQNCRFIASFELPASGPPLAVTRLFLDAESQQGGMQVLKFRMYNFAQKKWDDVLPGVLIPTDSYSGTAPPSGNAYVLPVNNRVFVEVRSDRDERSQMTFGVTGNSEVGALFLRAEVTAKGEGG